MTAALLRTKPAPPVRIVHLGVGAFSRSHAAWYTAHAKDADEWGIAAYSGRSTGLVDALQKQDCVYTLIARSPDGDRAERIESIVRAHAGGELSPFLTDLASPQTAIVTLTITEAGYMGGADAAFRADRADLSALGDSRSLESARPRTALGRLALGLEARRRTSAAPLALVSCDNLPDNGGILRERLLEMLPEETAAWAAASVAFVSCSVDRITPALSDAELERLRTDYGDAAPVVAEPFSDWVLSGDFPAGRPAWETAGARFAAELEQWEARKLWLLNGAHTILACSGILAGHDTVAEAIADPECRALVEDFWDEASSHLPERVEPASYRLALIERFRNARIVHRLSQIALDSETKLRLRIAPVAERERRLGRSAAGCARAFAAWLRFSGEAEEFLRASGARPSVLARISSQLDQDAHFRELVASQLQLSGARAGLAPDDARTH